MSHAPHDLYQHRQNRLELAIRIHGYCTEYPYVGLEQFLNSDWMIEHERKVVEHEQSTHSLGIRWTDDDLQRLGREKLIRQVLDGARREIEDHLAKLENERQRKI